MKRFLPQIVLLCASLLFMAGIGEIALRIAVGAPIIWRYPQERYEHDPELGHRLAPNQSSFTHDKLFETNSMGIRAPEIARHPARGTRRLLAVGDSQTAGDGLLLEDTWPSQLARQLQTGHPSGRWEVLNGGLSGSSPWQYAILLERLAKHYEFEGVVVALYVNDVTPRPESPVASVVTNSVARRIGYILKRSALITAAWRARQPIAATLWPDKNTDRETRIITGEADPLLEQGWRDLEISLREIREFTREREMALWLVILPRRDQVGGSQPGRAYNERSAEIARRLQIPYVDVLEALTDEYATAGQGLFITWDGHDSALANRVIAQELARLIATSE